MVQDSGPWMRPHAGQALALAHFLDEAWATRPPKRIEASPWYEAAAALARRLLLQAMRPAPKVRVSHTRLFPCMGLVHARQSAVCTGLHTNKLL